MAGPLVWSAWVKAETATDRLYRSGSKRRFTLAAAISDALDWARQRLPHPRHEHDWLDDQCGLPEHRYCAWCGRLWPAPEGDAL